jgi:hypothetical protein
MEDFRKSRKIVHDRNLICQQYGREVVYRFEKEGIIRQAGQIPDTFKLKYSIPVIEYSKDIPSLVGELTLECFNNEVKFPVNVIKQYPLGNKFENISE